MKRLFRVPILLSQFVLFMQNYLQTFYKKIIHFYYLKKNSFRKETQNMLDWNE